VIQLYRPGTSALHRAPAGVKLAGLAIAAITLSAYPHTAMSMAVGFIAGCALFFVARLPASLLRAEIWRMRWLMFILGLALWIFVSPLTAWINTTRIVTLVLLASLLTFTTKMSDLLAVLHRMLSPLRRFRVDADAVSMTISLTITMVPVVAGFAQQVREAQQARGVRLGIKGVVPLLVWTLRHSDDVGDALTARGLV
jgi:biotin transport system permease protein